LGAVLGGLRVLEQAAEGRLDVQLRRGNELRSHYLEAGRQGKGFKGIQHAKVLAIEWQDSWEVFAGSSNWTTASRGNHELGWRVELQSWRVVEPTQKLVGISV